jgi:hypothetical protein
MRSPKRINFHKSRQMVSCMKFVLSSVLGLVILFSQFNSSIILVNYQLNKGSITEKYCVNKNKPEMKCNGKCHVKTELERSKRQDNKMNFSKENETAKFFVKMFKLKDVYFVGVKRSFSPYIINFSSRISDITTPPPRLVA